MDNLKVALTIFLFSISINTFAESVPEFFLYPGILSFPEDIQFRSNDDKTGQIVFDSVSPYFKRQLDVNNENLEQIRKTLSYAESNNAMVLIEDIVKGSVQIPVISVNPRDLRFVKVRPGESSWGAWVSSGFFKNTFIEIWSGDVFLGTSCFGCSNSTLDEHILNYTEFVQIAIDDELELVEVNLTKDSYEILVRDSEFKSYDPNLIGIQAFYFHGDTETPGGFSLIQFQKKPDTSSARLNTLNVSSEQLFDDVFLDGGKVFFKPNLKSTNSIEVTNLTLDQFNRQQIKIKGVAVVDGFKYFQILGSQSTIFQYREMFRSISRVLAKAIAQNKNVKVNLDRRGAMQMLMTVE